MMEKIIKNIQLYRYEVYILLISIIIRIIYNDLLNLNSIIYNNNYLYIEGIKNHFFEYLNFYHVKPPINLILDKLIILLSSNLSYYKFLSISILNSISVTILFIILKSKINKYLLFVLCLILSLGIMIYENWRMGLHHDHIKLFIIVLYLFVLHRFLNKKSNILSKFDIIIIFISSILISLSTSTSLFYFITITIFILIKFRKINIGILYFHLLGLLFSIFFSFKVYNQTNYFTQSTVLGQNILQLVYTATDSHNSVEFKKIINNNSNLFPEWWINSFNVSINQDIKNKNIFPIMAIYGLGNRDSIKIKISNVNILETLTKDNYLENNKPWILQSEVNESSSLFATKYNKASSSSIFILLKEHKLKLLKTLIKSNQLFLMGPLFFTKKNIYEPQLIKINRNIILISTLLFFILLFGYFEIIINLIFSKIIFRDVLLLIYIIINGIFLNFFTCCENLRFFVPFTPIFFIYGCEFIQKSIDKINKPK